MALKTAGMVNNYSQFFIFAKNKVVYIFAKKINRRIFAGMSETELELGASMWVQVFG